MDATESTETIYADIVSYRGNGEINKLANGSVIDYRKLRVWLFQRAKQMIQQLHPDWFEEDAIDASSLEQLCELNITRELKQNLPAIIRDFVRYTESENDKVVKKTALFRFDEAPNKILRVIDERKFRGGLTELHEAVKRGDFAEVKRLVEVEKARTDIKDNDGRTPYFYAIGYQHQEIADYLTAF